MLIPRFIDWIVPSLSNGGMVSSDWQKWLSIFDHISQALVTFLTESFAFVIPSYLSGWVAVASAHPYLLCLMIIGLWALIRSGNLAQSRSLDRARVAWSRSLKPEYLAATKSNDAALRDRFKRWTLGAAVLGMGVPAVLWIVDRIGAARQWWTQGGIIDSPMIAIFEGAVITALFAALWWWRSRAHVKLNADIAALQGQEADHLPATALLDKAYAWRTSPRLVKAYDLVAKGFIPWAFAVLIALLVPVLAYKAAFHGIGAAGAYCASGKGAAAGQQLDVVGDFDTSDFCWASGATLVEGRRYEITIQMSPDGWFDRSRRADTGGVWKESWLQGAVGFFRRWSFQPYFQPIARIGRFGADEYVLTPVQSFDKPSDAAIQCAVAPELPDGNRLATVGNDGKIDPGEARRQLKCAATPGGRDKLTSRIKAKTSGELFVYVNDVPGFYRNNSGKATVTIKRIDDTP